MTFVHARESGTLRLTLKEKLELKHSREYLSPTSSKQPQKCPDKCNECKIIFLELIQNRALLSFLFPYIYFLSHFRVILRALLYQSNNNTMITSRHLNKQTSSSKRHDRITNGFPSRWPTDERTF